MSYYNPIDPSDPYVETEQITAPVAVGPVTGPSTAPVADPVPSVAKFAEEYEQATCEDFRRLRKTQGLILVGIFALCLIVLIKK